MTGWWWRFWEQSPGCSEPPAPRYRMIVEFDSSEDMVSAWREMGRPEARMLKVER